MKENLEAKVKSITDKLVQSRKKHVGEKKSSKHVSNKIARALEDSLRGKDDVLSAASPQQRAILDRAMMETFEFIGDPTKSAEDYQKILLEQLERIHAVRNENSNPEAKEAIKTLIERQIHAAKELKIGDMGIGKAIGGIFFEESFSKDLDALGEKIEKLINGGGLFGSTKKKIEQATLRGQAAKEMKDIGLKDPFHTHEHDDEKYYRHRREDRQAYNGQSMSQPNQPSSSNQSGSKIDSAEKPEVDEFQSSFKMPRKDDVIDVEPKQTKSFGDGEVFSPKSFGTGSREIQKLNVAELIVKHMTFPKKEDRQKQKLLVGPDKPKPKSLLGYDKKKDVTDAIIKRETITDRTLEKMADNEGDRMDAMEGKDPTEKSGILSSLSDASLGAAGGKLLGNVGVLAKGAAAYALPAATMVGAGAGVDAIAGAAGVGGNKIDETQDDANWNRMTWSQKIESGLARGTEKVGSALFLGNISNEARANRIKKETEYLNKEPGVSLSNIKSSEITADTVEKSADARMHDAKPQESPTIINNTTNNTQTNGEKKSDTPPAPASSRPSESTFTYWQRNVFLK